MAGINDILLRILEYPPLTTKATSDLTPSEVDTNFIEIYKSLQNTQELIFSEVVVSLNKLIIELTGSTRFFIQEITSGKTSINLIDNGVTEGIGLLLAVNLRTDEADITFTATSDLYLAGDTTLTVPYTNVAWFYVRDNKKYLINKWVAGSSGLDFTALVAALVAGTNINFTVDNAAKTITINATGGGGGDEDLDSFTHLYIFNNLGQTI